MGPYLTVPKKEKQTENGENKKVIVNTLTVPLGEVWSLRNARVA